LKQFTDRKIILVIFCFLIIKADAQSANYLKGVWKGTLKDSASAFEYTLKIEKVFGNKFFGTSISSNQSFYCETKVLGSVKNSKVTVYEAEIAKTNYKNKAGICLLALNLMIENGDIIGKFRPITNTANCLAGSVKLSFIEPIIEKEKSNKDAGQLRESTIDAIRNQGGTVSEDILKGATAEKNITKTKELKNIALNQRKEMPQSILNSRTLSLIKEIRIDAEEVEISLYDNGIIDGDSITMIDNQVPVFQRIGLSTKPLKYIIDNKQTEVHSIAFLAENLGSIPPNTGLMIISANRKRWEVNFSSDYSSTSFVRIILAPKQ